MPEHDILYTDEIKRDGWGDIIYYCKCGDRVRLWNEQDGRGSCVSCGNEIEIHERDEEPMKFDAVTHVGSKIHLTVPGEQHTLCGQGPPRGYIRWQATSRHEWNGESPRRVCQRCANAAYKRLGVEKRVKNEPRKQLLSRPAPITVPWCDCKVALAIDDDQAVWKAHDDDRLTLPKGWYLCETNAPPFCTAVFRINGIPGISDGLIVRGLLRRIGAIK